MNLLLYVLSLVAVLPCFLIGLFFFLIDDIRRHQTGIKAIIDFLLTRTLVLLWGVIIAVPVLLALIIIGYFPNIRWIGLCVITIIGSAGLGYIAYSAGPSWLVQGWLVTIPAVLGTAWSVWRLLNH